MSKAVYSNVQDPPQDQVPVTLNVGPYICLLSWSHMVKSHEHLWQMDFLMLGSIALYPLLEHWGFIIWLLLTPSVCHLLVFYIRKGMHDLWPWLLSHITSSHVSKWDTTVYHHCYFDFFRLFLFVFVVTMSEIQLLTNFSFWASWDFFPPRGDHKPCATNFRI